MARNVFEKFVDSKIAEEKDKIYREAVDTYLSSEVDYSVTIEQFRKDMMEAGIWDHVKDVSMIEFANIINPPTSQRGGRGQRMTRAEKQRLVDEIPGFLEAHPWSKRADIASAMRVEARKLTVPLRDLTATRTIKKHGERGGTVYAVRGEKTKPE